MRTKTLEYFCEEVCRFRDLMGQKTFWQDEEKKRLAVKGLAYLYIQFQGTKEENEKIVLIFEATMLEYTKRESLVACMV